MQVQENVVNASCKTDGSYDEVVYCTECKTELSRTEKTIEKLDHTPGTAVKENVVNASCKADGSYDEVVYCTECKTELSRTEKTIDKLDHTPGTAVKENVVAANCKTAGGYDEVVYCTACNDVLSRSAKVIAKTDAHRWNTGVTTKEATVDSEGEKTYTCTICGETRTEIIEKINCNHICHSDSKFKQRLYKIALFFWKLFGTHKYCDCGMAHY